MLWGGGGQGIPVRYFIRFALPCPTASCVGKPTMVVVAVQGPPRRGIYVHLFVLELLSYIRIFYIDGEQGTTQPLKFRS